MNIPDLKSPASRIEPDQNSQLRQSTLLWILTGIIVCLILIIIILLLRLQTNKSEMLNKQELYNTQIKNEIKNVSKKEPEKSNYNEQIEIEWLLKKTQADTEQVNLWAETDYNNAITLEHQAQEDKRNQRFESAAKEYKQAIKIIEHSLVNKAVIKNGLIQKARKLLAENEIKQARQAIKTASVIASDNNEIKKLQERINRRSSILELEKQAKQFELANNIEAALNNYKKIIKQDDQYKAAQKKVEQLNKQIKEDKFKQIIGQLIVSLDNNNIKQAHILYTSARSIYPNDPVVIELKQRINNQKKTRIIKDNLKRAEYYQQKEQWYKALKAYNIVLSEDPNSSIAQLNIERVKKYISLNKSLDKIIQATDRLQENRILENSKAILFSIRQELKQKNSLLYALSKTPALKNKIIQTEKIIKDASRLINIKLMSDNKTNIVIYRVGKFGRLLNKDLKLHPGNYTIVGSREGYKDYRKTIGISAEKNNLSILVICKEKI